MGYTSGSTVDRALGLGLARVMDQTETYLSTDIEAGGPIPGVNSMLPLGSVGFDAAGRRIAALAAERSR